jgi:hypothetical protein
VQGKADGKYQWCAGWCTKPWEVKPHPWRAVCIERCTHGSERGSWKRDLTYEEYALAIYSTTPRP